MPAKASTGPSYLDLAKAAIVSLNERNGSSLQAIKKFVMAKKKTGYVNGTFLRALKSAVFAGKLIQVRGSYKLNPSSTANCSYLSDITTLAFAKPSSAICAGDLCDVEQQRQEESEVQAGNAKTQAFAADVLLGAAVRKKFHGFGEFDGVVTELVDAARSMYAVQWDDGDTTRMKRATLVKHLVDKPRLAVAAISSGGGGSGGGGGGNSGGGSSSPRVAVCSPAFVGSARTSSNDKVSPDVPHAPSHPALDAGLSGVPGLHQLRVFAASSHATALAELHGATDITRIEAIVDATNATAAQLSETVEGARRDTTLSAAALQEIARLEALAEAKLMAIDDAKRTACAAL